jgi:transketolase
MRKEFTNVVSNLINTDSNTALLLGDIGVYGFREALKLHPDRVFNMGILEQSMVGVGAGLASEGVTPFIHSIAPFLVERALEQIKVDFGYQNLPGNLISVGASFDYAKLGCTHHCPSDVSILSNIPNLDIFIPGHSDELKFQLLRYWNSGKLNYYRLSEHENTSAISLELGEIKKVVNGRRAVFIAVGPFLSIALSALSDHDIEIHYVNSIDSFNSMEIKTTFPGRKVIIYEPYYSGAILLKLSEQISAAGCEVLQIGVPKKFLENYGTFEEQMQSLELDLNSIQTRVEAFLAK